MTGTSVVRPSYTELERALAYYVREYDELGARVLKLQEDQSRAFREARRSRTVAKLIRDVNRLADTGISLDELGARVLEIIVENVVCDRAALLVERDSDNGAFELSHAVGLGRTRSSTIIIAEPPPFSFTSTRTVASSFAATITEFLGVPYVLWAFDANARRALVIGNAAEVNVNRAFDATDREIIEGGLSVYLDVFARKRAELQLREAKEAAEAMRIEAEAATRAKSLFLAAMSHEIRTPMTAVLGMADLLARDPLRDHQRRNVDAIRHSGAHLLAIINDIIDFSRLEAGRVEIESVDFALAPLCEEVLSLLRCQAAERGLDLSLQVDQSAEIVVKGDATRVRQILLNLVGNGLKYTLYGNVALKVSAAPLATGDSMVRFEVRDSGIGIPLEHQEQLFQPFEQLLRPEADGQGGAGLGLAICKRLVDALGGRIGLESQPGAGSLFWFELSLPLGSEVDQVRPRLDLPAAAFSLRVLVAEDAPLSRELLAAMLENRVAMIEFAVNGEEAVELASTRPYDLLLMDVQMPKLSGVDAARRIRQLPLPKSTVPIVGLTANVLEADRRRYLSVGMDRILLKPIDWNELFSVLEQVASGRGASPRL